MAASKDREKLIVDNIPLVGFLASKATARTTHFPREDLVSAGTLALVRAADAYDPSLGVPFSAYAARRIKGAFSDEMRSQDWATRAVRSSIRAVTAAKEQLRDALDREPTVDEIAAATGLARGKVSESLQYASRTVTDLDDDRAYKLRSDAPCPEMTAEENEEAELLRCAVESLPERMRMIVTAIYFDGETVKDVAERLSVGHSAVSMQRSEALKLLRDAMGRVYKEHATETPVSTSKNMRDQFLQRMSEAAPRYAGALV